MGSVPIWARGICVLVLSVAVPATSWYLMESPLLKLKERLLDGSPALVGKALESLGRGRV